MKSKLIIFDLDGTLIDTLNDIKHIFNYVLVQNSFEKKSKEFYKKNIGNGLENLLRSVFLMILTEISINYQMRYEIVIKVS